MSQPWTVKAWAGAYSWTAHDNDAAPTLPLPAAGLLVAPFTVTDSLPTTDLAPMVQRDASTASFRVVVASTAALDQLQLGDPVTLRYFGSSAPAGTDKPLVEFAGRVSSLDSEPSDLGMVYTVGCVDYTVDLAELPVGTVAYPQESLDSRVRRILAEAGVNVPATTDLYGGTATIPLQSTIAARPIGPTNALELLTHTLAQYRMEFTGAPAAVGVAVLRPGLVPIEGNATFSSGATVLGSGASGPYLVLTAFRSPSYTAPLRVTLVSGVYKLVGSTANGNVGGVGVVDAGRVDKLARFSQRKADSTNAVQVNSDLFTPQLASWAGVNQRITASVDTELVNASEGAALALAYLSPVKPASGVLWIADAFAWLIDKEPGGWGLPAVGRGFMVVRIKPEWSPLEKDWYVGQVSSRTFQVTDGVPSASIATSPWNVDGAKATNPVKYSDLVAGQTFATTSTTDTWLDYTLAGI